MLETLILMTCLYGKPNGCTNASNAYYKTDQIQFVIKKYNKKIKKYTKNNEAIAIGLFFGSIIKDKKVTIPVMKKENNAILITQSETTSFLIFKRDF